MGLGDGLAAMLQPLMETKTGRRLAIIVTLAIVAAECLGWLVEQARAYAPYVAIGVGLLALVVVLLVRARGEENRVLSPRTMIAFGVFFLLAALGALFALRRRKQQEQTEAPPDPGEVEQLAAVEAAGSALGAERAGAGAVAGEAAANANSARLAELAKKGFMATLRAIPGVVLSGLKGGLKGFFLVSLLGALVATAGLLASSLSKSPAATWFLLLMFFWLPFVFALAGGYSGTVKGLCIGLVTKLEELGVVNYLYALVRPAMATAATRVAQAGGELHGAQTFALVRGALDERIERVNADISQNMPPPSGISGRIQRALARRAQRVLCHAAVHAALKQGVKQKRAVDTLEQLGLQRLREALGGAILGALQMQMFIAYAAALVAGALPYALYLGLR